MGSAAALRLGRVLESRESINKVSLRAPKNNKIESHRFQRLFGTKGGRSRRRLRSIGAHPLCRDRQSGKQAAVNIKFSARDVTSTRRWPEARPVRQLHRAFQSGARECSHTPPPCGRRVVRRSPESAFTSESKLLQGGLNCSGLLVAVQRSTAQRLGMAAHCSHAGGVRSSGRHTDQAGARGDVDYGHDPCLCSEGCCDGSADTAPRASNQRHLFVQSCHGFESHRCFTAQLCTGAASRQPRTCTCMRI